MDSIELAQDYLTVDKLYNRRGVETTELKEHEGKLIIKQYSGIGTDNFVIKKYDGKKIAFSFFKINGIQYININGEHIFDYRKFIKIQQVSNIEPENNSVKIKNTFIGDFIIHNCDIDVFKKSLDVMDVFFKNHRTYMKDLVYFLFN